MNIQHTGGKVNIKGVEIGPGQPCRIVAEVSNAHNGSLARAHRIIEAAKEAGADFVKFQAYTPDELISMRGDGKPPPPWDEMTMHELYTKAMTPHGWFPSLSEKCDRVGIPWFSSVFGLDSLEMLERNWCPVYKLSSLDIEYQAFRRSVHMTGKPIIQSRPKLTDAIDHLSADLTLWCPPGYPQTVSAPFPAWADGFSYHGTDWEVAASVAKAGAQLIEVHVQLDDEPSELEEDVSLTMSQLKELCDAVKPPKKRTRGRK